MAGPSLNKLDAGMAMRIYYPAATTLMPVLLQEQLPDKKNLEAATRGEVRAAGRKRY